MRRLGLSYGEIMELIPVKPHGTDHRKNHLEHGVCTLVKRRSTDAYITTMSWVEFFQARYGF